MYLIVSGQFGLLPSLMDPDHPLAGCSIFGHFPFIVIYSFWECSLYHVVPSVLSNLELTTKYSTIQYNRESSSSSFEWALNKSSSDWSNTVQLYFDIAFLRKSRIAHTFITQTICGVEQLRMKVLLKVLTMTSLPLQVGRCNQSGISLWL